MHYFVLYKDNREGGDFRFDALTLLVAQPKRKTHNEVMNL